MTRIQYQRKLVETNGVYSVCTIAMLCVSGVFLLFIGLVCYWVNGMTLKFSTFRSTKHVYAYPYTYIDDLVFD